MNVKKVKTIKALKTRLKKTLPDKISKVFESYEGFMDKDIPDDAKAFNAHHTACKSAVIHAETLLKLARWTNDEVENRKVDEENEEDIWKIIEEAREYKDREDES